MSDSSLSDSCFEVADLNRRFSGTGRLFGSSALERLCNAHVVVIGVGGVGSWAAEALARSAIGKLTLIDMDHITESNVNRQVHALSSTLGASKVLAMQQRISLINPLCEVACLDTFVEPENWPALLPQGVTAVIDACDQVAAKVAIARWARTSTCFFISAGAAGGKRHAHHVDIQDLSATTHDPLLAQVRYRLRKNYAAPKEGKKIGIPCVFSREAVRMPVANCANATDSSLNCHGYGSLVSVTATFGMCAAGWILDKISCID